MQPNDWKTVKSPSLDDFEGMAHEVWARMPTRFRALCEGLVIRIDEFPDDDVLEEMDCESPFDLLGLFTGIGLAQAGAVAETGRLPNVIHLYRRPILDYWAEHDETLGDIIRHVLIHEIGHQVGLSDADMDAIEARA